MDFNNLLTFDRSPRSPSPSSPVDKEKENTNPVENPIKDIFTINTNEVNNTNRPPQKKGRYKQIPQKSLTRNQFENLFNIAPNNPPQTIVDEISPNNTNEINNRNQKSIPEKKVRYKQYPIKQNIPTIMPNYVSEIIISKPPEQLRDILNPIKDCKDEISPNFQNDKWLFNHEISTNLPIIIEQPSETFIQNINMKDDSSETEELNPIFPITEFLAEELITGLHHGKSQIYLAELLVMKMTTLLKALIENNPSKAVFFKTQQKFLMEILFFLTKIKLKIQSNKDPENYIKMIQEKWPNFFKLVNTNIKNCSKEERINNYQHARNIDVYKECLEMLNRAFSKENEIAPWLYTNLSTLLHQKNEYDFESNFSHIETAISFVNGSLDYYLKAIHTLHSNTSELDEQFVHWLENFIIEIECYKDELIGKLQDCLKNSRQEVENFIEESSGFFNGNFNLQKYANLFTKIREFNSLYATITSPGLPLYAIFEQIENLQTLKDEEKLKIPGMSYLRLSSFAGFLCNAVQPLLKMSKIYFDQLNTRLQKIRQFNNN